MLRQHITSQAALARCVSRVDKEVERERWTKQKLAMRRQSSLGERRASQLVSS